MFWDKGYMPSQNIEALLEKENATVEEFLDDEDILQECKTLKKGIVNYFTRSEVITRLVEIITTEPLEDLPMAQRYRHANMACEILTLGIPSLDEIVLLNSRTLMQLYSYLENEPPLNPLLASFFSKTFSMLFTKKAEQDWFLHQQLCLQFLEYIKYQKNFLDLICKHFDTPIIPDLIMQMMNKFEGGELKRNLYEWLAEEKLVERLIAILGNPQHTVMHANVAEFFCDLVQQGRTMRQTETENDSFEPAFEGSNPILETIEKNSTVEALLNAILSPDAQESAIVAGISVVLTLLRPVVFIDEQNSDRWKFIQDREKDKHEQILTSVISVIAPRLKQFNELLKNPPNKPDIVTSAAKLSPPFGMTRLQICRVFTVLLETKNEEVSKVICEIDFFETLLALFKQYCWNNFLHSEVEKCLQLIFYTQLSNNNNSMQGSTIVNDGSFGKGAATLDEERESYFVGEMDLSFFDDLLFGSTAGNATANATGSATDSATDNDSVDAGNMDAIANPSGTTVVIEPVNDFVADVEPAEAPHQQTTEMPEKEEFADDDAEAIKENVAPDGNNVAQPTIANAMEVEEKPKDEVNAVLQPVTESKAVEQAESSTTQVQAEKMPSPLQTHVIVNCKLLSKLIDYWQYNNEVEAGERGRRLGYMGHLIKIFKHITHCISESEHIGALIECNFANANELQLWHSIINPTDGDFTKALQTQNKMLANCNVHEAPDFVTDASTWDFVLALCDSNKDDIVFALENDMYRSDVHNYEDNGDNNFNLFQFCHNIDGDDDEDEDNAAAGDGHSLFGKSAASTSALQVFGATNNAWDNMDPFNDVTSAGSAVTPWATDFNADNFADFDAHFSTFANDLGESLKAATNGDQDAVDERMRAQQQRVTSSKDSTNETQLVSENAHEYDNNANVEKTTAAAIGSFELDQNVKNEKVATSIVRSLHSVIDDSDDDYEDDEGMWTKPLGVHSASNEHDDDNNAGKHDGGSTVADMIAASLTIVTNGPLSKSATLANDENAELYNNSLDGRVAGDAPALAALDGTNKTFNDVSSAKLGVATGSALEEQQVTSTTTAT